ncbi:MAG: glycosyltransferase family 4 protein [Candidatus Nanopelagicaceae bacterium]|nr:glycosyltransferase family 4 protein [Candidatus Nanopelagicaceae bacterium]
MAIFIEAMRRAFDSSIQTEHFLVGRRATDVGSIKTLLNPLSDAVRLAWHVLRVQPDVVHINPSLNMKSVLRDGLFLLVLRLLGKREVLMFIHGWEESLSARIARNRVLRNLFRYVYGWPLVTIVLARRFREQLLDMGFCADRIRVDTAMFESALFDGLVRQKHVGRRLVFVSRLVAGKGMWELLDAYAALKPIYPDLTLWFVGDGNERAAITQAVTERSIPDVTVTGFVSAATKAQILLDGDLFVFPTTYGEGCPASLLEAMAAGLPCITTRVGGIPDIFADKKNGVLLNKVTAQTVADAIASLLSNARVLSAIADRNRTEAWSRYESYVVSRRIASEYRSVAVAEHIQNYKR